MTYSTKQNVPPLSAEQRDRLAEMAAEAGANTATDWLRTLVEARMGQTRRYIATLSATAADTAAPSLAERRSVPQSATQRLATERTTEPTTQTVSDGAQMTLDTADT